MRALHTVPVTPEEVGFAGDAQIGKLRTRVQLRSPVKETRYLIAVRATATQRLGPARRETRLLNDRAKQHHRLDTMLAGEPGPRRAAAHILGMCRRLAVGLCSGCDARRAPRKLSPRDFRDHLTAHGAACAFALVTAANPTAWLPN